MVSSFLSLFRPSSDRSLPNRSAEERFGSIGPRLVNAALRAMGGLDFADPRTLIRAELPSILAAQRTSDNPSRSATYGRGSGEDPDISAPMRAEGSLVSNSTLVSGQLSDAELESLTSSGLLVFGDQPSSSDPEAGTEVPDGHVRSSHSFIRVCKCSCARSFQTCCGKFQQYIVSWARRGFTGVRIVFRRGNRCRVSRPSFRSWLRGRLPTIWCCAGHLLR
jgi:hypothetical protein